MQEWTCSQYEEKYRGKEQVCVNSANRIVRRGGSWADFQQKVRSAARDWEQASKRSKIIGFRVVRE
ncbi:Sulphatase-modifying factor domain protein [Candidatus Thiomargarita nelsonii]|uniref:Sulphatase-modifying factor domain protein n=1 Tax=Candidatus Thiomargarita nelsonii TaxID=1003181 RepID=A0A176S2R3_9GAMM|nr:Sulphatase-modifying factor domain protein [Candidatus Thiomargarita nelsonii]